MGIDLIGSGDRAVAVVEIEKKSKRKIKDVAREIMGHNKNVKAVVQRTYGVRGKFRLSKHKLILGEKNVEVLHKEYGYTLKVNPSLVYFSPRESTVRQHIARQVKPQERVLVMFAGICPYAICIAKNQPKVSEIVAVEFNPKGIEYMKENIRMNKVSHLVTPIEGDVRRVSGSLGKFDRIIMPMKEARDFLDVAVKCSDKSAIIDVYMISEEKNLFHDCEKFISGALKKLKAKYEIVDRRKISLYAPGKWKVLMGIKLK